MIDLLTDATAPSAVLVIGGAGLVGSHVARAFDRELVSATYHRARLEGGIQLDITDPDAIHAVVRRVRPDVIVLAAAEAWVDRCEREPHLTRRVNVDAARVVSSAAGEVDALLVVFSSEYVFDGTTGPYGEDDPVRPINEYGRQKVALEGIARSVRRHIVCRTSGVFGPERAEKNFVCQVLAHLRSGRTFPVASDQVITPTYAPDLARAVVELVRRGHGGTLQVVGPRIVRRADFARAVADAYSLPAGLLEERPTAAMGYAAPRPLGAGLRDDKIRSLLGDAIRAPDAALADMRRSEGR